MSSDKRRLQNIILSIAIDLKKICDKHDIPYFIIGGTQLGAVRHGGFIPWDDDFDLGMKRNDYNRFLKACETDLDKNKYFIQTEDTEEYYAFSFGKIQLKGTEFTEKFSKNVPIKHGIFVDVFPYDNIPDGKLQRIFFLFKNHILKTFLWIKCGYGEECHKKKTYYKLVKVFAFFISKDRLKKMRLKLVQKYNSIETKQSFTSDYPREHLMNVWFNSPADYKFETEKFQGFREVDKYLKNLYGNYMEIPPVDKRKTHTIEEVDFGNYKDKFEGR